MAKGLRRMVWVGVVLSLMPLWGCAEDDTVTVASLRSPRKLVYAPTCVVAGEWQEASACAEDNLKRRLYIANEQSASVAFAEFVGKGAKLVDTRAAVPGTTGVPVGDRPRAMAATADGAFVLVSSTASQDLSVVEVARAREVTYFSVEAPVLDLLHDPASDLFWALYPDGWLQALSLDYDCGLGRGRYRDGCDLQASDVNLREVQALQVGGSPRHFILDGSRGQIYVVYADRAYASIIALREGECLDGGEVPCEAGRVGLTYGCADGIDNDGDGWIDAQDPQCYSRWGAESADGVGRFMTTACNDGIDNDGDGLVDAFDPGCVDGNDASEVEGLQRPTPSVCADGIDNDGDGLIDNRDPGCMGPDDDDESGGGHVSQCDDGIDNDGDTLIDFPEDDGCESRYDDTEDASVACADGLDNDGDGLVDMDDPGCASPDDLSEVAPPGPCSDGLDNDGDGLVDLADPGCYGVNGTSELELDRVGWGPLGLDPEGRWLYVVDPSNWELLVVDLETVSLVDAGARNPQHLGAGVKVNPLPLSVVGDRRRIVLYDAGGVRLTREETLALVATASGRLDVVSIEQRFVRSVGGEVVQTLSLPTLRVGDTSESTARVTGMRCVDQVCTAEGLPGIELRRRPAVLLGQGGELVEVDGEGRQATLPADEIFTAELWRLTYEGVLPGSDRSDGVVSLDGGRLSSGASFCALGVEVGDRVVFPNRGDWVVGDNCEVFRAAETLEWEVAHVRGDALYLRATGQSGHPEVLPTRACFPFGVNFEVRAPERWVVAAERTSLHARRQVANQCLEPETRLGPGRFAMGASYENAFFSLTLRGEMLTVRRNTRIEFVLNPGYSPQGRGLGALTQDLVLVTTPQRRFLVAASAGSNAVFVFDAEQLNLINGL